LSTKAKDLSFSYSDAFKDFVSRQKKMLTPDGESGKMQKKSAVPKICYEQSVWILGMNYKIHLELRQEYHKEEELMRLVLSSFDGVQDV
jgi:hypothetical protein